MIPDHGSDQLEEFVAGGMTFGVVDHLQANDVDVNDDEQSASTTAAIYFAHEVRKASRSGADAGDFVGRSRCERESERLSILECLPTLAGGLFAVSCCKLAVFGGQRAMLGGSGTELRVAHTLLSGTLHFHTAGDLAICAGVLGGGAELRHREIARRRSLIARERGEVARVRHHVAPLGDVQSSFGGLLALPGDLFAPEGRPLAYIAAGIVRARAAPGCQLLIAGDLILVRSQLIRVSARLIAIGARLIDLGERLVAVGERLLALTARLLVLVDRLRRPRRTRGETSLLAWSLREWSPGAMHVTVAACGVRLAAGLTGHDLADYLARLQARLIWAMAG